MLKEVVNFIMKTDVWLTVDERLADVKIQRRIF